MVIPPRQPTMQDVARLAGVSTMTVSRALRENTSVGESTREKIRLAADELGYVINSNASSFASHKTGFVAVTIPSINNANFADTVTGLTEGLRETGLQILLGYTGYSLEEEERLVQQLLQRRPEAVVITGGSHTPRCRKLLKKVGVPVIEIWDQPKDPIDEVVGFSNADAAGLMVDHFVERGFSRIGFIGGNESSDVRGLDRRRGFRTRLVELGLDDSRMVYAGDPPVSMDQGVVGVRQLLEKWPDTEAVMCVSDLSAFGAISYCSRNGISVPGQLSIAGFGAYDIAELSNPTITTIDVDARYIGEKAAELIAARIASETIALPTVTPRLVEAESTAAV